MKRLAIILLLSMLTAATWGVTFEGKVETPDGKAVRGVKVVFRHRLRALRLTRADGQRQVEATTDAKGRFALKLPSDYTGLNILVEPPAKSGLVLADMDVPAGAFARMGRLDEPVAVRIIMDSGKLALAGTVSAEDGKPVKGAVVTISRKLNTRYAGSGIEQSFEATTDAKGRYRFASLLPADYSIESVTPPRDGMLETMPPAWRGHGGVRVYGPDETTKDFTLKTGCAIRGRVVDEAGRPVAVAIVSCTRAAAAIDGPKYWEKMGCFTDRTTTARDGTYRLMGLSPETYTVSATSPETGEFAPAGPLTGIRLEPGKTVSVQDVVMVPGGQLTGIVTDADGKPLRNLDVYYGDAVTSTDATGRYRFTRLATGKHNVELEPPPGSPWAAKTVEDVAAVAKVKAKRDFRLERGGVVTGVVKDDEGRPVRGASLTASFDNHRYAATADAKGRYTMVGLVASGGTDYRGRPKRYGMSVTAPGDTDLLGGGTQFDVALGQTKTLDVTLRMGGRIEGTVTDEAGKPVVGASVQVYKNVGRGGRSYYAGGGPGGGILTDAEGRYAARKLPADAMNVSVTPPAGANLLGDERSNVIVKAGEATTFDVKLAPGGVVKGFVVSPKDARMPGVQVTLVSLMNTRRQAWNVRIDPVTTGADGTFRFAGLPAGKYRLSARAFDASHVFLPEDVDVVAGKEVERMLAAITGAFIELTLTGPDGKPAANVSARTQSKTRGVSSVYGRSDAEGKMTLGPLLAGTYDVKVNAYRDKDRTLKPADVNDVTVKAGERVKREVKLEEGPPPPAPRPGRR